MAVFYPRCRVALQAVFEGGDSVYVEATPLSAQVNRNGYSEADTWSLDFNVRVLPFDPDLLTSIAARIYMWDAGDPDGPGDREAPDEGASKEWAQDRYLMVAGLADEPSLSISLEDQSFSMSGRDYTSILDPEWDPKNKIPAGRLLTETIQEIADAAAPPGATVGFRVEWRAIGRPIPRVGAGGRSSKRRGLNVKPGKTYWDTIYDLAIDHGCIAFVADIATIVITDSRSATLTSLAQAPRLVYGRDLLSLEVNRRLAKEVQQTVKVRGIDVQTGKRVEVQYPATSKVKTSAIGIKRNEFDVVPAPSSGPTDRESLLAYARNRFEMKARAEASYKFRTAHMRVYRGRGEPSGLGIEGGNPPDADLLQLQAGDPVYAVFDPFNRESMRSLDEGSRAEHIESLGYSPAVARTLAANFSRLDVFQQPYYTRCINYDWTHDGGLEIEVEAVNYANAQQTEAEVA